MKCHYSKRELAIRMDEIRREAWSLYKYGDWNQGIRLIVKEKIAGPIAICRNVMKLSLLYWKINYIPGFNHFSILNAVYTYTSYANYFITLRSVRGRFWSQ